ncbi:Alpha/Beta hydrolase protein [Xylariaceae sp. FL0804]|nr:Alpha/Beta hydrolase protein [Xylariaceae sp. FL0804]
MLCKYLSLAAASLVVAAAAGALAAPSPQSLNSDITLLFDNDLQGAESPSANSAVLLLSEAQPLAEATRSCAALGEQLWSPAAGADIQANLNYLAYEGVAAAGSQFWIAPDRAGARAIDVRGDVSAADARRSLPVLCAQSAPFSNATWQDNSTARWQVTVESNNEYLTGFRDRASFRFLGIRYAPQPERFTYSVPYAGNGSAAPATAYGSECAQAGGVGSEDCLFLNIWTGHLPNGPRSDSDPAQQQQQLKPVMFWMHGGAYTSGTANDPTFDGGNLASRGDVVMVAVNYRLSTLGFLALDDDQDDVRGNYGLADQINALGWVQRNIADFGGDPARVTIFGQSAGAGSVRAMLASPRARGLFAAAVPQSNLGGLNYGTTYSQYLTVPQEMALAGDAILAATNCSGAASRVGCLRAVPAATLVGLADVARYVVVDGDYITSDQLQLGPGLPPLPVHIMMGTCRDDGGPFITYPTTTNESAYLASQGFAVPPAQLFPVPDLANGTLALFNASTRLATDGIFRCVDQATAYAGARDGRLGNVYFYEFNRTYQTEGWPGLDVCEAPPTPSRPHGDPDREYFKCHSGELYYVFGNVQRTGLPLRDANDLPFSQSTLDAWAAFARAHDPNPDPALLRARGRSYENTLRERELAAAQGSGPWTPAGANGQPATMRTLQWPSFQGPFVELAQCEALGLPLDYYLKQ